ncbi:MAG: hypothetical protein ACX93U_05870 [Salipiger thiooxidans]|uniref:hypothetical protein n=1 Tax=Salipiger thiooxidans TaxID=282683 RepID=UPI001CFB3510|nr:hypothetical protein [Salipiger thiooxidans]
MAEELHLGRAPGRRYSGGTPGARQNDSRRAAQVMGGGYVDARRIIIPEELKAAGVFRPTCPPDVRQI